MPLNTSASPSVTDALNTRLTVRDFLDTPVPNDVLTALFEAARRAPSGGNLQPWKVHVLTGDALSGFVKLGLETAMSGKQETPTHPGYPSPLWEPQRTWRHKMGEDMYSILGIPREDKPARMKQILENMKFFGAPVGIIITGNKDLNMPQYLDIGIYLQTLMLLAREAGFHTAPQGWWRQFPSVSAAKLNIPEDEEVMVGMGMGYGNADAPINDLVTDRGTLAETVQFYS
ncbi:MAG: nitroreductase [Maricaulaceae bacterium]